MEGLAAEFVEFAENAFRGEAGVCPKQFEHIWDWFTEINLWRPVNREDAGPEPLTLTIINGWAAATGTILDSFTLEIFNRIEAAYWMARNPKQEPGSIAKQFALIADKKPMRTIAVNPGKKK